MESELFGHVKGAFTGAIHHRKGAFEEAQRGILFLDEIGEIDKSTQTKLLRAIEQKAIKPVGGNQLINLDIQIVSATNKNLEELVNKGEFREDLYHRLCGYKITIPPLRERKEDIIPIAEYLLKDELSNAAEQEVIDRFLAYNWSGNVRELANALNQMNVESLIRDKEKATLECLPEKIRMFSARTAFIIPSKAKDISLSHTSEAVTLDPKRKTAIIELDAIERALKETGGKKSKAAALLDKKADDLRYSIKKKFFPNYPELFSKYPLISKVYDLAV